MAQGNVWIVDCGLHQVLKFAPENLRQPGERSSALSRALSAPVSTAPIGDPGCTTVVLSLGVALEPGHDSSHFCKPTDVAIVASDGTFFVLSLIHI